MLDAMLFQSNGNLTLGAMGVDLKRWGNEIPFSVPTNIYQCRDGLVMAGVLLDTHWKVLARMTGRDDLAHHDDYATIPGRMKNRDECNAMFAQWCAARTVDEAVEECAREAIPCAKVRTYAEAARCPHTLERDMLQEVRAGRRQACADHRAGGQVLAHADADTKRRARSGSAYGRCARGTWNRRRRAQAPARRWRRLAAAPAATARRFDANAIAGLEIEIRFAR